MTAGIPKKQQPLFLQCLNTVSFGDMKAILPVRKMLHQQLQRPMGDAANRSDLWKNRLVTQKPESGSSSS